jgi:hypothetical protein
LTVTLTASNGATYTYAPGDGRVRAVIQAYPDPVSKMVVADGTNTFYPETDGSFTSSAMAYFARTLTQQDSDWSNTLVLIDLPADIPTGPADIRFATVDDGPLAQGPVRVEVLPGPAGAANPLMISDLGSPLPAPIKAAERAPHYAVSFTGPAVPHALQVDLAAGPGPTWVTHGRGDLKSLHWSLEGGRLRVLLTPAQAQTLPRLGDLKFYVAGAPASLRVTALRAYDLAGVPLAGYEASVEYVD